MRTTRCRRALLGGVAAATAVLGGACQTPTGDGGGPVAVLPPTCPFDEVVQIDGDSLAAGMAPHLRTTGHSKFSSAVGGSSFTVATEHEPVDDRVLRWLARCGAPDLVVIEAGLNDLIQGVPVERISAEVLALDAAISDAGSTALWVTVPPLAQQGGYASWNPARRAFNDWMRSAAELSGRVVDVVPALQDPDTPDTLAPWYLWYSIDIFKPDGLHPNAEGYRAMAAAVQPAIDAALAE